MKHGWELKKLGEVCEFMGGSQPPKSKFIFEPRQGFVRFLQIRDFASDKNITYIPESKKNRYCQEDDILLGRYGASVGKVLINKVGAYNVAIMKTVPHQNTLNKRYLFFYLNSDEFQSRLSKIASRSAQNGFSKEDIFDFPILIPPLLEQQRLVSILDKAFASIIKAKANAEQNLKNAKELFESYLHSVFANNGEDWAAKRVRDLGITQTGTTPKTAVKENYGNFIPFIKPADIDFSGIGDIRYNNEGLSELGLKNGRKMARDSILMVCIGATIGKVGFAEREVSCNQQINSLTVKPEFEPKFFYYGMSSMKFQEKVLLEGKGAQATLPIINKSKWENLTISFPKTRKEQLRIVRQLDGLRSETQKLEVIYQRKIDDLKELKKSILQKTFTGELVTT